MSVLRAMATAALGAGQWGRQGCGGTVGLTTRWGKAAGYRGGHWYWWHFVGPCGGVVVFSGACAVGVSADVGKVLWWGLDLVGRRSRGVGASSMSWALWWHVGACAAGRQGAGGCVVFVFGAGCQWGIRAACGYLQV
jgi:hypothetical protein